MASSYPQWRAAVDRGDIRRVTWVCGPARVLVEEIVDTTVVRLGGPSSDCVIMAAEQDSDAEIWDQVDQKPLGVRRLVVVRNAQLIRDWEPLHQLLAQARGIPVTYLLLVSREYELAQVGPDDEPVLAPYLAALQAKPRHGMLVRCAEPSIAQTVAWARRRGQLTEKVATHLVARTGGDLRAIAAACDKLALFEGRAGVGVVDELTDPSPAAGFVDSLILLRRADAVMLAGHLDEAQVPEIIQLLDQRLDLLGQLHALVKAGRTIREMNSVPRHLAAAYLPAVKFYDAERRSDLRQVLAIVDDAWRSGARDGVMEALVALW